MRLNGTAQLIGPLSAQSEFTLVDLSASGAKLTTTIAAQGSSFAGAFSGNGQLNKMGSGVLSVSGASPAFLGDTTVTAGTLAVSQGNGLGSGKVTVEPGGQLQLNNGGSTEMAFTASSIELKDDAAVTGAPALQASGAVAFQSR